jgi:peptidoglycan/LPS O-acetylase OafA/YrhL
MSETLAATAVEPADDPPIGSSDVVRSAVLSDSSTGPLAAAHLKVPKPHLASLDGLRGLACLMVVCHHCWLQAGAYPVPLAVGHVSLDMGQWLFAQFNVGVDLFFALSGFCLAAPLIRTGPSSWNWGRYLFRRCKRILPPFWIACAVLAALHFTIQKWNIRPFAGQMLTCETNRELAYTFAMIGASLNISFGRFQLSGGGTSSFPC